MRPAYHPHAMVVSDSAQNEPTMWSMLGSMTQGGDQPSLYMISSITDPCSVSLSDLLASPAFGEIPIVDTVRDESACIPMALVPRSFWRPGGVGPAGLGHRVSAVGPFRDETKHARTGKDRNEDIERSI